MPIGSKNNQVGSLVLLGVFIVILMILLSWSFRTGNVIAGSFQLDDIQISDELDDNMKPLRTGRDLPGGSKQVCLWFNYSKAREGDSIEITWSHEGRPVQQDSFRLSESKGFRAFYLLKEDGSALPFGTYSVTLFCNGREKTVENFTISATSDDVLTKKEEIFDD